MRNENETLFASLYREAEAATQDYFSIEQLQATTSEDSKKAHWPESMNYFEIIIVLPDKSYCMRFSSNYLYLAFVHIPKITWYEFQSNIRQNNMMVVGQELGIAMHDIITQMQQELGSGGLLRSEMLSALLSVLLIHLFRNAPATALPILSSRDKELTDRFLFLVRTQFSTLRGVADYAKRIHVSANYLNCVIKKVTGKTARHHIYQQIILEAKKKVNKDNGSLKEIAAFLGFDDPAHFSKFFKKNCGVNFSVFKKTYRYEI
jgi:AraC family transcriptional regulator, transcriptional activator of pobA